MPFYDTPAFYIDFSELPPPAVIETIAYEDLLAAYKARVLVANPKLAAALKLEQSATNIILQTEAYGEMLVRARINAAARAVMLAFATGTDLDNLAALYNVVRLVNADGTSELDPRFRLRVQEAAEAFSVAGPAGAYRFHARTADPSIFDVVATKVNNMGGVQVTIMNTIATPAPTSSQITNVLTYLSDDSRRPLTDDVRVTGPAVTQTEIDAEVTLYPGPDATVVLNQIGKALDALRLRVARIGYGLERSAIITAINQEGVQNVNLISPPADINPGTTGVVTITSATVTPLKLRTF